MDTEIAPQPLRSGDFWAQGLDWSFLPKVYRTSTQVGVVAALILMGLDQRALGVGLLLGLAVALLSTWSVEVTVRLLFKEGSFAGVKLAVAACFKLPVLLAALFGVAWAVMNGHANVFMVVGGVLLVHAVIFFGILSQALAASDTGRAGRG
ncbi:MAG: hypothetical protein FJX77_17510 [Armatimonadetes bacterium]|nr:hypothetical protein [Armatimonadota bacterium]